MEFNRDFFARLYFFARRAKMLANKKIPKVLYCPKAAKKNTKFPFSAPLTCYIYTFMKMKNISC